MSLSRLVNLDPCRLHVPAHAGSETRSGERAEWRGRLLWTGLIPYCFLTVLRPDNLFGALRTTC